MTLPKYENWLLRAIDYKCGLNSKSTFNNFFKKYTDMTPTEYKIIQPKTLNA